MNPQEEHVATRRAAGLFDFSFMGLYEFQGKTELASLQTRNLDAMVSGEDLGAREPAIKQALEGSPVSDIWEADRRMMRVGVAPIRGSAALRS